jgi:hypothetical protein
VFGLVWESFGLSLLPAPPSGEVNDARSVLREIVL